tara:strand:- start:285 stop:1034 length:750 start_codon:yes stop_codon:yes gene_type:complete
MASPLIGLVEMQIAFAIALLGIYIGWRTGLSHVSGFYDLTGAARHLLYGIVIGMIFAVAVDRMILAEIVLGRSWDAIAPTMILIGASQSMLTLVVTGRPRTVRTSSSMPYGWTFGLGLGSMQAAYVIVRLFDPETWAGSTGFGVSAIFFGLVISATCALGTAAVSAWQGTKLLHASRLTPTVVSTLARALLIASVVLSIFEPLALLLAAPPAFYVSYTKGPEWAVETLSEPSKKEYRRMMRREALSKKQ